MGLMSGEGPEEMAAITAAGDVQVESEELKRSLVIYLFIYFFFLCKPFQMT